MLILFTAILAVFTGLLIFVIWGHEKHIKELEEANIRLSRSTNSSTSSQESEAIPFNDGRRGGIKHLWRFFPDRTAKCSSCGLSVISIGTDVEDRKLTCFPDREGMDES
jgi:hypothetical protein